VVLPGKRVASMRELVSLLVGQTGYEIALCVDSWSKMQFISCQNA